MVNVVEIIKVDKKTLNTISYEVYLANDVDLNKALEIVKTACNVGDFVKIESKYYKRIRGGWKEVDYDDLSVIIASQIKNTL